MARLLFTEKAWQEYLYWQTQDKKTLKRINLLLQSLTRGDDARIGKAELLKGDLSGFASLRIDPANRLVYRKEDNTKFFSAKGTMMNDWFHA